MTKNEIIKKYESLNQVHYHNKNDRDLVEQMMQEYADQQLILSGVVSTLKCDFCGADEIYPNLDIRLYQCKCGATKSF